MLRVAVVMSMSWRHELSQLLAARGHKRLHQQHKLQAGQAGQKGDLLSLQQLAQTGPGQWMFSITSLLRFKRLT